MKKEQSQQTKYLLRWQKLNNYQFVSNGQKRHSFFDAEFLILIKSMSKMDNHIVVKQGSLRRSKHNTTSSPPENLVQKMQEKKNYQRGVLMITQQGKQHESSPKSNLLSENEFQSWALVRMSENQVGTRKREEKLQNSEKNISHFNDASFEEEYQFLTPNKPESFEFFERRTNLQSSADRNGFFEHDFHETKTKTKGLRMLSARAFKIVQELGQVTYKKVAHILIKELKGQQDYSGVEGEGDAKQENNIKRRVYDALNVLIAITVLQKNGRNIIYSPNSTLAESQLQFLQRKQSINDTMLEIKKKAEILKHKKEMIKKLKDKIQIVKKLNKRNNQTTQCPSDIIKLPFVCVTVHGDPKEKMKKSDAKFEMSPGSKYQFFGDVDFLLKKPSFLDK